MQLSKVPAKSSVEAIPLELGDSPSQRVTAPVNAIDAEDEGDELDDGDRIDGENAAERNEQRAVEELPAERPVVIAERDS